MRSFTNCRGRKSFSFIKFLMAINGIIFVFFQVFSIIVENLHFPGHPDGCGATLIVGGVAHSFLHVLNVMQSCFHLFLKHFVL